MTSPTASARDTAIPNPTPTARTDCLGTLLVRLIGNGVIPPEDWDDTPAETREELSRLSTSELLVELLDCRLLTAFQADAIRKGMETDLVIGSYRLLGPVFKGGSGAAYKADHIHLRRRLVAKLVLVPDDGTVLPHRAAAAARAAARIKHPNIVPILDAGRHNRSGGQPWDYYVSELVPGTDLRRVVRAYGSVPPGQAAEIFRQVAEALAEVHRHGLVHHAVKPSNIVVSADGQARLLNFGLGRRPSGGVKLTPYSAPEQVRNPDHSDARTDLFGVGAALYLALSGHDPRPPRTGYSGWPADVREFAPEVPGELADLVTKLTNPDPDRRFQSARALAGSLAGLSRRLPGRIDAGRDASASAVATTPPPGQPTGRDTVRLAAGEQTRQPTPPQPIPGLRGADRASPVETLAFAVCRLMEETGQTLPGYHARLGRYLRSLAAVLPERGEYARLKDPKYLAMLTTVAPIHDLGQLVVPTQVLLTPGRLDADEATVVQTHTVIGSQVIVDIAARLQVSLPDLTMAAEVVRHHHERWDGAGYPDGLAGPEIPLAARAVSIVTVYEALRTRRPHRPPLTHEAAARLIGAESPGQFDPTLVEAFRASHHRFDDIFSVGWK